MSEARTKLEGGADCEAHLHRYLAEADFRYNHREKLGFDDTARAAALLAGTKGKRLLYSQPDKAANA